MALAKVWPLRPGVPGGVNHLGGPVTLQPGVPGFMEIDAAREAARVGDVQLMAGETMDSLKTPVYDTREVRAQESMSPPEVPKAPEKEEGETKRRPRTAAQAGRRPGQKSGYIRSDLKAEKVV